MQSFRYLLSTKKRTSVALSECRINYSITTGVPSDSDAAIFPPKKARSKVTPFSSGVASQLHNI
jgi:hypothetical protein